MVQGFAHFLVTLTDDSAHFVSDVVRVELIYPDRPSAQVDPVEVGRTIKDGEATEIRFHRAPLQAAAGEVVPWSFPLALVREVHHLEI